MQTDDRKQILIIEDEEVVANKIASFLQSRGYFTSVAYDGESGFEKIKNSSFDAIILDIMLPKLDGRDILKKIKELEDKKNIPVLILSAKTEPWDREIGFKLGATDYIDKPLEPMVLLTTLSKVFRKKN